jgi:hypothetical protein
MNRPPRLSGSSAPSRPKRRETDRGSFSFSSSKESSASLAAKHFGGSFTGSDWSGSKSVDSIKQRYNAGE